MEDSIGAVIIEDRHPEDNLARKERYQCYSLDAKFLNVSIAQERDKRNCKLAGFMHCLCRSACLEV